MGKNSRKRQTWYLRKSTNFLSLIQDIDLSEFEGRSDASKFIGMLRTDNMMGIRSESAKEAIKRTVDGKKTIDDVVGELVKDVPIRPPYDSILFEFSVPGYLHYAVCCMYLEERNILVTRGVRTKQEGRGINFYIDESTTVIYLDDKWHYTGCQEIELERPDLDGSWVTSAVEAVFSLALINCRNIVLTDEIVEPSILRQYQNQFKSPMIVYKTLRIRGISSKNTDKPRKEYQALMPLHLRRGNFAHYTEDAPLFGKLTGTFWRPATVVGEEQNGKIVKDYVISS